MVEKTAIPELEIEHIFGYRTSDTQQNLHYNSAGEAVFMCAAVGIVQNTENNTQRFYGGKESEMKSKQDTEQKEFHNDDIVCLDLCIDRTLAITGQVGKWPSVHVWNSHTCERQASFQLDKDSRGVQAVSISPCKKYVAAIDQSNDHKVFIYNLERSCMLLTITGGKDKILDIQWSKRPDDLRMCTVSAKDLRFWNPADVTKKLSVKGTFQMGAQQYLCCTFDNQGWCYTGTDQGQVLIWNEQAQVAKQIKLFGKEVTSCIFQEDKLLCGSKDNKVAIISVKDGNFSLDKTVDLESGTLSNPKSLDFYKGNLLVGLRNGAIHEYKNIMTEGAEANMKTLMQSHFEGECWGVTIMDNDRIITVCDDNRFMEFNFADKKCERIGTISTVGKPKNKMKSTASTSSQFGANKQGRCVAHSDKHKHLVVCSNFGKISVRDFDDFSKKVKTLKDCKEWCEVAYYSPDQSKLAVGSHDDKIHIYLVEEDYKIYCRFQKHSSFITSLDWSLDGSYLRSTDGAHTLLYFDINKKEQDTHGEENTKDMEWATHHIKIGKDRDGCRPAYVDKTHINDFSLSPCGKYLISADDFGLVNIFNYPVPEDAKGKGARSYIGHSEHVVRARWGKDGKSFYSVGGEDKAIIKWRMKE